MARTKTIDPDVRTVLGSLEWDGPRARLTCGQISDRKLYLRTNDVLESFGGKWSKKEKAHVFAELAHDELDAAIETGVYVSAADLKQVFGEFETPDELADEVVRLAKISGDHFVLEPSAGSGQLIKAVYRALPTHDDLYMLPIEIQAKHRPSLEVLCDGVHTADFLSWEPQRFFDRVIMNPPFVRQADIDHVTRAYGMLARGGMLVAIMSPGWLFRTNSKSCAFGKLVAEHGSHAKNPEGSFKCAGTNVNTVIVTLQK